MADFEEAEPDLARLKAPLRDPSPTQGGIWLSTKEIMALPTRGAGWDAVLADAHRAWGDADLSDLNAQHDVLTLAGALVAVRLNDSALREKVIGGLQSAMCSQLSRALELSRGLQAYVIAADLIGYRADPFKEWVADMVMAPIQSHSAGNTGLYGTALHSSNNWGGHARASLAAAAIYLNRRDWKSDVTIAQREMIGLPVESPTLVYQETDWHADASHKAGVNRKRATIQGVSVSGALPEDWRRAAGFKWPPDKSVYMWEGLQGLVVTAVILHRAGLLSFSAGDNAIVRAFDMLYGRGEGARNTPVFSFPPEGDDCWLSWVVNKLAGTSYPPEVGQPGKGMGYAEWTHQK